MIFSLGKTSRVYQGYFKVLSMNVRTRCAAQALRRLSFNREHHEDSTPKQCSMGLPCIHAGHQLHGKGDGAQAKAAPVNRRVPALQTAEQPKAATPPNPLLLVGGETAVFPKAKTQIQPPAHHPHLVDIRPQVFDRHRKGCNLRHPGSVHAAAGPQVQPGEEGEGCSGWQQQRGKTNRSI